MQTSYNITKIANNVKSYKIAYTNRKYTIHVNKTPHTVSNNYAFYSASHGKN